MVVDEYISELNKQPFFGDENIIGSLRYHIKWYKEKAKWRRRMFRITGTIALIFSISLPFVSFVIADKEYYILNGFDIYKYIISFIPV